MKYGKALMATLLLATGNMLYAAGGFTYKKADAPVEDRVNDLLSRMTIDEKIGQLNQRSFYEGEEAMKMWQSEVQAGNIGSLLNIVTPDNADAIQKVAMEKSRLGTPVLMARDVIHGYKTVFPIPLGQAATFDDAIVELGGRVAAVEASSDGIRWTFTPMMDISRDARWGRIAESFGEDTYLSTRLAVANIRGLQGEDPSDPTSIAACAKHFVGYGASESGRDYNSTYIPPRQLRDVYLPPFKAAVEAGVLTFMTSFNDNDGVPATGNRALLKDVLRDEWGFKGFVVSDWGSIQQMIPHGFCPDLSNAADRAFNAGVDMDMEGYAYISHLKQLIESGKVSMGDIDNAVKNVLRVKFMLGLFENPYVVTPQSVKYDQLHHCAARKAAELSSILLINYGVLPLKGVKKVFLTGPLADAPHEQMGTWTFDGEKSRTVTIAKAMRDQFGSDVEIVFDPCLTFSRDRSTAGIPQACSKAAAADVIVAVMGEESILSGEGHSRADITLPGAQNEYLEALKATGKPLVTVVMTGRPMAIPRVDEISDALLYVFHPGTMGGPAIADILFGKVSPSGKLPVSLPRFSGQTPLYYNQHATGRPATGKETLMYDAPIEAPMTSTGCSSYYFDAGFGPLYPFGYGLSYGRFTYSDLCLDSGSYTPDGTIRASVTLTNDGDMEATEVVQLYVKDHFGSVTRPVRELKQYSRVTLKPHESTTVRFELPVKELAFTGLDMKYAVEPGDFTLYIGGSSKADLAKDFKVN